MGPTHGPPDLEMSQMTESQVTIPLRNSKKKPKKTALLIFISYAVDPVELNQLVFLLLASLESLKGNKFKAINRFSTGSSSSKLLRRFRL